MDTEAKRRPLYQFSIQDLIRELERRFNDLPYVEDDQLNALRSLYDLTAGKQLAVPEARERKPWELENDKAILGFYGAISGLVDGAAEAIGIPTNETWIVSDFDPDIKKEKFH